LSNEERTDASTPTLAALSAGLADAVAAAGGGVLGLEVDGHPRSAVAWSDTLAITTARGLGPDASLTLILPDGTEAAAALVGVDPRLDVAVLRAEAGGLSPLPASTAVPRPGELVLTLGRGVRGLGTTLGIVQSSGPAWTTAGGADVSAGIAVDASLPESSAGGALVDAAGKLLGLNTPRLVPGGTTLPVETLRTAVAWIEEHGSVQPGLLGVRVRSVAVPPDIAAAEGVSKALLVIGVPGGGPAARAGIETGDVLLRIDGQAVGGLEDLRVALSTRGGQPVEVRRLRAGVLDTVEVTPKVLHRGGGWGRRGPWRRRGHHGHGHGHGHGHKHHRAWGRRRC
jgi:S1-C subfamily serine protease